VGQNLARQLLRRHAHVLVYDLVPLPPPLPTETGRRELFKSGDITDQDSLLATMRAFNPTCVIYG